MLTGHTSAFHFVQHLNVHYFIVIICHIVSHLILSFLRRAKEKYLLDILKRVCDWIMLGLLSINSVKSSSLQIQQEYFFIGCFYVYMYHRSQDYWRVNFFFFLRLSFFFLHFSFLGFFFFFTFQFTFPLFHFIVYHHAMTFELHSLQFQLCF